VNVSVEIAYMSKAGGHIPTESMHDFEAKNQAVEPQGDVESCGQVLDRQTHYIRTDLGSPACYTLVTFFASRISLISPRKSREDS